MEKRGRGQTTSHDAHHGFITPFGQTCFANYLSPFIKLRMNIYFNWANIGA
jgi:hypothetical protein